MASAWRGSTEGLGAMNSPAKFPPKTDAQIIMERITRESARHDRVDESLLRRIERLEQALGLEPPMPDYPEEK